MTSEFSFHQKSLLPRVGSFLLEALQDFLSGSTQVATGSRVGGDADYIQRVGFYGAANPVNQYQQCFKGQFHFQVWSNDWSISTSTYSEPQMASFRQVRLLSPNATP